MRLAQYPSIATIHSDSSISVIMGSMVYILYVYVTKRGE